MRKKLFTFLILMSLTISQSASAQAIRTAVVRGEELVAISTALGYSTTLLLPEAPESVILGDQNSFKIEFFKEHLAIKPLAAEARSNLVIVTPKDRFHCLLTIGPASKVDHLIKIERPHAITKALEMSKQSGDFLMTLEQFSTDAARKWFSLQFKLTNRGSKKMVLLPAQTTLKQGEKLIDIDTLYLERADLKGGRSIGGMLRIKGRAYPKNEAFLFSIPCKNHPPITVSLYPKELL